MSLQVTVIGDSHADAEKYRFCELLGKMLAEMDVVVITGGRTGVMEAVCKGAFLAGGNTIGLLPGSEKKEANKYCRVVIPTGMGHGRNSLTVLAADVVIVIGGQAGTLTEMGFAWIYNKPIIAIQGFGGWAEKMSGVAFDARRSDKVIGLTTLREVKLELQTRIKEAGKFVE